MDGDNSDRQSTWAAVECGSERESEAVVAMLLQRAQAKEDRGGAARPSEARDCWSRESIRSCVLA